MLDNPENATLTSNERQSIAEVSSGVTGSKEGIGIGQLVDSRTIEGWVGEYCKRRNDEPSLDEVAVKMAFQFGVKAEGRYAGKSFVVAEPEVRSEWSCERDRLPWESVRDAVWAGFDRARDQTL